MTFKAIFYNYRRFLLLSQMFLQLRLVLGAMFGCFSSSIWWITNTRYFCCSRQEYYRIKTPSNCEPSHTVTKTCMNRTLVLHRAPRIITTSVETLCLNRRTLLHMEYNGAHTRDVPAALGSLGVKVTQLGDTFPFCTGLRALRVRHQLLLGTPAPHHNNHG